MTIYEDLEDIPTVKFVELPHKTVTIHRETPHEDLVECVWYLGRELNDLRKELEKPWYRRLFR